MNNYFNTTHLNGEPLQGRVRRAEKQEKVVLAVYEAHPVPLSPSQVHKILLSTGMIDGNTPITSIRRAISNLTGKMMIYKTENKVMGIYGSPEYQWEIIK